MNLELAGVAEKLVYEFPEFAVLVVIETVCDCAGQCDAAGPFFIEQAARACLTSRLQARVYGLTEPAPAAAEDAADTASDVTIPAQVGPRESTDAGSTPHVRTAAASA